METFPMSVKEISRISIFERLRDRNIKQKEASMILGLSTRQIRKKLKEFRRLGLQALIHSSRGKPSNNQLNPIIKQRAVSLIKNKYPDFGPTFAAEKLAENHKLIINRETLRLVMVAAGLWRVKAKKVHHRQWRERKGCLGQLVQLDGSDHNWFEDRAPRCTLLAFIDDATGRIMRLEFAPETTMGVMGATKRYIAKHGLPYEIYVDRGKVFKVNIHNEEEDKITQYRRAIEELGGRIIYARSPQAKGRVERLFGTLQDRLVKELRLKGISNIEEANRYVGEVYLPWHNERYAIDPKSKTNLHRATDGHDLNNIFCLKERRVLTADYTLRHKNKWYQLEKQQKTLIFPGNEIAVNTHLNGSITLSIRNTKLYSYEIDKPLGKEKTETIKQTIERKPWKPPVDHPWRNYKINYQQKVTFLNC